MTKKWEVVVNHKADLLSEDLILTGIYHHSELDRFGASFRYPYIQYDHATGDISWATEHIEELQSKLLPLEKYQQLLQEIEASLAEYRTFITEFEVLVKSGKTSTDSITRFFDASLKPVGNIARFVVELGIAKELERQNIPLTALKSAATDTSRASEKLAELAARYASEIESHKQSERASVSDELMAELTHFCEIYGYLGMKYFLGSPWTTWQAYEMLVTAQKPAPHSDDVLHDSPYVKIAQELLRLRTVTWELMCYGCYLFRNLVNDHYAHVVTYDALLGLRMDEVMSVLNGEFPSRSILSTRDNFILEINATGVELLENVPTPLISDTPILSSEAVKELKGLVAQKGHVTGKAKIVLTPKDGYKVEPGDILVTTMSTPDFLPAMMRAAAFVTDIGGITSHAAIVSREMKKPCIIGTKVATKVLRDGDLIEVDANQGIVKRITEGA